MLQTSGINAAPLQHVFFLCRKVLAHYRDYPHIGKVTGRERKVRSCPAKAALRLARRRLYAVKRNTAHHQNRHECSLALFEIFTDNQIDPLTRLCRACRRIGQIAYCSADAHAHLRSPGIAATAARTTFAAFAAFWFSTATICSTVTSS